MDEKVKIELEYPVKIPKRIVFNRLSTSNGLNEWFADNVSFDSQNEVTFSWNGQSMTAKLVDQKKNQFVRFQWLEDAGLEYYFEFTLQTHELTKDTSLIVTDFVDADDRDGAIELWNKQIIGMMRNLGRI